MNNKYFIYNCEAVRSDKTNIIRIIKIPSHFQVEDLAISLIATSDEPGNIKEIEFENDGVGYTFDILSKIYQGISFDELDEFDITVKIKYIDNTFIKYECKKVGEDIQNRKITRTTPIILAAMGMSRFSHDEYRKIHYKKMKKFNHLSIDPNYDGYYATEDLQCRFAMKDLQRIFNLYKDDYYA